MKQALISIRPCFAEKILDGNKTVEVRRRRTALNPGTTMWIYVTKPLASIYGFATVKRVDVGTAPLIWRRHSRAMGISKKEYERYVDGAEYVSAIVLEQVTRLPFPLTLAQLRRKDQAFQPPQFFLYLHASSHIRELLHAALAVLPARRRHG